MKAKLIRVAVIAFSLAAFGRLAVSAAPSSGVNPDQDKKTITMSQTSGTAQEPKKDSGCCGGDDNKGPAAEKKSALPAVQGQPN